MIKLSGKKISFDFDGTLEDDFGGEPNRHKEDVQKICRQLLENGRDVYIITKRYGPENSSLGKGNEHLVVYEAARKLGIPMNKVHFTNRIMKYELISKMGIDSHFENADYEVDLIKQYCPQVTVVWVEDPYWKDLVY